jgi:tRNA-dihydrouridine synthase B
MSFWNEQLSIANLRFPRFIAAPLDGITDSPYRRLIREFSSQELLFSEMRHVACVANDKGAMRSLDFQIAANNTEYIARACERIMAAGVDLVDLNVGCPARNVIGSGSGSALMADIPRLREILLAMRQCLSVPFTVKIRSGFKAENAVDVAKLIEDCGASAITIHPRLQTQKFEGRPDYSVAARVKQAVHIPVLVSGNIVNWATAKMVYEQTGVDGFLVGRALWSRPWKLQEMDAHRQGAAYQVDVAVRIQSALRHLEYALSYYGPRGLYTFRKYIPLYIHGALNAAALRKQLMTTHSSDEVREGLLHVVEQRSCA